MDKSTVIQKNTLDCKG